MLAETEAVLYLHCDARILHIIQLSVHDHRYRRTHFEHGAVKPVTEPHFAPVIGWSIYGYELRIVVGHCRGSVPPDVDSVANKPRPDNTHHPYKRLAQRAVKQMQL